MAGGDARNIGPYEVVGTLGEGGMGVVYRGRHPDTGQQVALKTPKATASFALHSVRAEIAALARIEHPGIVRIIGHGSEGGLPWYAMELLEGQTWDDFNQELWNPGSTDPTAVRDDSAFDFDATAQARPGEVATFSRPKAAKGRLKEVLTLARRLCTSLSVLHGHGFVHRDLKPANIFLVDTRPVLTDLGIASRFRGAVGREKLEQAGKLVGTLRYMAPEQARGMHVDARADLYSLGTVLFETITGRLPFRCESVNDWMRRVLNDTPPAPSELVEGCPKGVDELIMGLLAKRPRDRIGHADDVARLLELLGAEQDELPGIETPAYLYRAEMAGRGDDLLVLEDVIKRAREGEGGMIFIGGESGVGKTFLASEAAHYATAQRLEVVIGECLPLTVGGHTRVDVQGAPLHPIKPLLQRVADRARTADDEVADRLLVRSRAALLALYEPTLLTVPGVSGTSVPELPGESARLRLMEALYETLAALIAEDGPIVLMIDDLQWADDLTLAFLDYLASGKVKALPVAIIGTYRSDEITDSLKPVLDRVEALMLGRLDEGSVKRVVGDMLALAKPPDEFVRFLAKHSEGNPFFVAEYLRLAVAEGVLERRGGRWHLGVDEDTPGAYAELGLPASLLELVSQRLRGLTPAARTTLEAASVLGREFDRELLQAVLAEDETTDEETGDAIKELVVRQVLDVDGGDLRFVHDKLRESAYDDLKRERKLELSHRAAVALEARASSGEGDVDLGMLAQFWSEAEVWSKAIDALERAAEGALRDFSTEQAIRTFTTLEEIRKREQVDVGPLRRSRWSRGLADAHFDRGRDSEGREHVEDALVLVGQDRLPRTSGAQAFAMFREVVKYTFQAWLPFLFRVGPGTKRTRLAEAAYMYNRLVEPTFRDNQPFLAVFTNFRNVNLASRIPLTPALVRGYAMLANVAGVSPFQGVARKWAERSVALAEELGNDSTLCYALARVCAYYVTVGDFDRSDATAAKALEIAHATGDQRSITEVHITHAIGLGVQGRYDEQLATLSQSIVMTKARGDEQITGWIQCCLAESYLRTGRVPEAKAILPELEEWTKGPREQAEAAWAHGIVALVSLVAGDDDRARTHADRAVMLMRESPPFPFFVTPGLWALSQVYLDLLEARADASGVETKAILTQLEDLVKIFDTYAKMVRFARPYAHLARGGLAWRQEKSAAALSEWSKGLVLAQKHQMHHATARAAYELGRHQEGPDRDRHLNLAVETYEKMGAARALSQARAALESRKVAL
ncbi:MAG: protein kinase [Deltaproteobacteria bacterium]